MVRVAGLRARCARDRHAQRRRQDAGRAARRHPASAIDSLQLDQQASLAVLQQYLAEEDILIVEPGASTDADRAWLRAAFPRAGDLPGADAARHRSGASVPFIPNLGFSIALQLAAQERREPMTALLRLPPALDRFVRLPDAQHDPLHHAGRCGQHASSTGSSRAIEVQGSGTFRVIRDSDIEVEEEAEDLVRFFETALKRRRRGS